MPRTTQIDTRSLFRPGQNCCYVARAHRAAFLVDGADYFEAFMRAAQRAERSIIILAWDFDTRTCLTFDEGGQVPTALGDFLNYLAKRRRRLHIRVLDWDYPMIVGKDREFRPLYGLSWSAHRRVSIHYDGTHPLAGSHHQKIVVIDDKLAFVGGNDLTLRRWDTPEHKPDEPRRTANGKPYPPFHDLMMALDGDAARSLGKIARKRWLAATGERLREVGIATDPWPDGLEADVTDIDVAIACTAPTTGMDKGMRDVEQLYLDMIARAQRYIYIENQYFTSHKIGYALAARLQEDNAPEIVLVIRLLSHGWLEEMTMHVLRTRLIRELRSIDRNHRFHVYYPHVEGLAGGTCIDIHSKMMAVDDEWLRIGSSNLSNRSMGLDTECDVAIEAHGQPRISRVIRNFRDRLIGEHLGVAGEEVARAIDHAGTMNGAIAALDNEKRTLKPLDDLPEWSDTVVNAVGFADLERPVSVDDLIDEFGPDIEVHRKVPMWVKFIAAAALITSLSLMWRYTPLADIFTAANVTDWARAFASQWWAPLVILLAYTPACIVMFPRPLITLAAVVAFGPWLGFAYGMSGILIASGLTYVVGRMLARDTVRRIAGEKLNRMSNVLRQRGLLAVTALRLVPLAPFSVEGLVAGAIHIKLWHFLLGTFFGMLPGTLAATVFGNQIEAALRDPSEVNYWLVATVVIVLVGGAFLVRQWFINMERHAHGHAMEGGGGAGD